MLNLPVAVCFPSSAKTASVVDAPTPAIVPDADVSICDAASSSACDLSEFLKRN